jgi:hypothetical protein
MQTSYKRSIVLTALLAVSAAASAQYYVDNAGNDDNNGLSPETAWKSVYKVSKTAVESGATVFFKRGGEWRDAVLTARSGTVGHPTTYGAYGSGDKPRLLGSVSLTQLSDWVQTSPGSSIWVSQVADTQAVSQIADGDFGTLSGWTAYAVNGAAIGLDTTQYLVAANANTSSVKFQLSAGATGVTDIQLRSPAVSLAYGSCYHLSFWAKASAALTMQSDIRVGSNTGDYTSPLHNFRPSFGTEWAKYDVYLRANKTATDGQVRLFLGNMAASGTLNIDAMTFRACDINKFIDSDVGNVIFDFDHVVVGTKVMNEADLNQNGKFWYDAANKRLKMYSTENPAAVYTQQLEVATARNVIDLRSVTDVLVHDLELRNTGGHAVQATNSTRITLDNLDINYAGGSLKSDGVTRYGNGIEIFQSARDIVATNNVFWQIYDAAMTGQGFITSTVNGITFQNNLSKQSEHCFEVVYQYEPNTPASTVANVVFNNNTCVQSGTGWGHAQRPTPEGADGLFYKGAVAMTGTKFNNNILVDSANMVVRLVTTDGDYHDVEFSGNCYKPAPSYSTNSGLLMFQTQKVTDTQYNLLRVSDPGIFNTRFGTNTSTSLNVDPQLSQFYVPNSSGVCAGKGYVPPPGS